MNHLKYILQTKNKIKFLKNNLNNLILNFKLEKVRDIKKLIAFVIIQNLFNYNLRGIE